MIVIETPRPRIRAGFVAKSSLVGGLAAALSIGVVAGGQLLAVSEVKVASAPRPRKTEPGGIAVQGAPKAVRFWGQSGLALVDGHLELADLATGEVTPFDATSRLGAITAMDARGDLLALGDEHGGVGVADGHGVWHFASLEHAIHSIAFSHDGLQVVASSADGTHAVWRTAVPELDLVAKWHLDNDIVRLEPRTVAFRGGPSTLVVSGELGSSEPVELSNLQGTLVHYFDSDEHLTALDTSPAGIAAFGHHDGVDVWNLVTGQKLGTVAGASVVRFTPDGNQLVTGGQDGHIGCLELPFLPEKVVGHAQGPIRALDVSASGLVLVATASERLELFQLPTR
jgi:WD40 repeat protein